MVSSHYPPGYLAESRANEQFNTGVIFTVLQTVMLLAFTAVRVKQKTIFGPDTLLLYPAYIFCMAGIATDFIAVEHGGCGRHSAAVTPGELIVTAKCRLAARIIYPLAVNLPKMSILFLYLRIFKLRWMKISAYMTMAVVVAHAVSGVIASATICTPFSFAWDTSVPNGHCGNLLLFFRILSIPNLITDVIILVLPQFVVWNLHMGRARKIGLVFTFLTGSLGILGACFRLASFMNPDVYNDPQWSCTEIMTWTVAEPGIYFIAACQPSLVPLAKRFSDKLYVSTLGSKLRQYRSGKSEEPSNGQGSLEKSAAAKRMSDSGVSGRGNSEEPFVGELEQMYFNGKAHDLA